MIGKENCIMTFDHRESDGYKTEVKEKWGNTEPYKEYEKKSAQYSKQKQNEIAEGVDRIMKAFALCWSE